jgi:hypothetical protein
MLSSGYQDIPQHIGLQTAVNGTQAFVPQLGHSIERAQPLTQRPLEELLTALRKVTVAFREVEFCWFRQCAVVVSREQQGSDLHLSCDHAGRQPLEAWPTGQAQGAGRVRQTRGCVRHRAALQSVQTSRCIVQVHLFHITDNDTRLTWMSKDNRNRSISVTDIKNVRGHRLQSCAVARCSLP